MIFTDPYSLLATFLEVTGVLWWALPVFVLCLFVAWFALSEFEERCHEGNATDGTAQADTGGCADCRERVGVGMPRRNKPLI